MRHCTLCGIEMAEDEGEDDLCTGCYWDVVEEEGGDREDDVYVWVEDKGWMTLQTAEDEGYV